MLNFVFFMQSWKYAWDVQIKVSSVQHNKGIWSYRRGRAGNTVWTGLVDQREYNPRSEGGPREHVQGEERGVEGRE